MKGRLKRVLQFFLNPRFMLCFGVGWMITNGWSYLLLALGTWLQNGWMIGISTAYLAFLWLPVSPEKLVTVTIAIFLLRWWFPGDQKTLAILKGAYEKLKAAVKKRKNKTSCEQ